MDPNPMFELPSNHLLEDNYKQPFVTWKRNPNPTNAQSFLTSVEPVLNKALKSYARGSALSPTLKNRAEQIALNASRNYDPLQSKLQTYLMYHLQGLQRATAQEERIISAPEQVLLDQKHVYDASNKLRDELGRDPSDMELADHMSIPIKRIQYIRQMRNPVAESVFSGRVGEDESFAPAVRQTNNDAPWQEFVYHDLSPVEQLIMEHTLAMHGKPMLDGQALARRVGVSPGRISQIKAKIQQKLNMRDELEII